MRTYERNSSADTKGSEVGGGEGVQAPELRFPCNPWCLSGTRYLPTPWWVRLCLCSPCKPQEEQTSTCSPWRIPRLDQVDVQNRLWPYGRPELEQAPGRTAYPMKRGVHTGASFLRGFGILQGSHTKTVCPWQTAPRDRHMLNQFIKNYSPCKNSLWQSCGELCPVRETLCWRRGRAWVLVFQEP